MSQLHPKPWPQTAAVVVLVAVGLWFATVSPLLEAQATKAWPAVPCTVVGTRVQHITPVDAPNHYQPRVRCRYEVDGEVFEEEIALHTENRYEPAAKARIAPLNDGKKLSCYVNPDDPKAFVIDHVTPIAPFVLGLLLLFILCIGVFAFWTDYRKKIRALDEL